MSAATEIKALRTFRRERLEAIDRQKNIITEATKTMERLQRELADIEGKIDNLVNKEPIVTEHAMLRYLERVEGMDMEALRLKIMTPELERHILAFPNCTVPIGNGFQAVVRNRQVRTVEPKKEQKHRVRKSREELIAQREEYVE